ncbi:hypothetical protein OU798_03120 [Prolixibacteraceae bacterium Z1-6]|uniref:Type IX secretion system membrane protein PorP/SprF n=1 Tax=Draconibacterium aestuarii TaxID=2998507 RepID=A0A9X3F2F8_9BACT|nr:hypothetical protein [Prolixibacteraceae bacterium Z1-6]
MKFVAKILVSCIIFLTASNLKAQTETYLQPFSGLLILNPAFAGYDKNTSFHSGNQYYSPAKDQSLNLFYVTYDTYSDKLKGGLGLTFQHGLIGDQNITLSKLGTSYAGSEIRTTIGSLIPSISAELSLATKQWHTYLIDRIFDPKGDMPSPPGKQFNRYYIFKPGIGLLYELNSSIWGFAASFPLQFSLSDDTAEGIQNAGEIPVSLSFYFSKKVRGNRNGLASKQFLAYPEVILFYNKAFLLSRVSLYIEQENKVYGIFIQNDFTYNIHCIGGTFGWRRNNFKINLNTGVGIPGISNNIGVTGELSLNIIIPPVDYSKINPWAPKRKLD